MRSLSGLAFRLLLLLHYAAAVAISLDDAVPTPTITNAPAHNLLSQRNLKVNWTIPVVSTDSNGVRKTFDTTFDIVSYNAIGSAAVRPAATGCAMPHVKSGILEASGAKEFIKEQFDTWNKTKDAENHFARWYFQEWLPGVPMEEARCEEGFSCSVGSLENIKQGVSCNDTRKAYYGGQILATINHRHQVVYRALQDTLEHIDGGKEDWLTLFSEKDDVEREIQWNNYKERMFWTIFAQVMLQISGFLGLGDLAGKKNPFAGVKPFFTIATNAVLTKSAVVSLEHGKPGRQRWEDDAEIRKTLKSILGQLVTLVHGNQDKLLRGQADLSDKFIWNHAANFAETKSNRLAPKMRKRFINSVNAPMLDHMWRSSSVYITQSNVGPTRGAMSCEIDSRGPRDSKVCLDDHPGKVFYVFQYSRMKGNPVMLPRGMDSVDALGGDMDLKNIVRASVAHYNHQGFFYDTHVNISAWFQNRDTSTANAFDRANELVDSHTRYHANETIARFGGPLAGLIHLPVARCNGGECISGGTYDSWHNDKSGNSIKQTKGFGDKNLPCMVGAYDNWHPPKEEQGMYQQEQGGFLSAAILANRKSVRKQCKKQKCSDVDHNHNPRLVLHGQAYRGKKDAPYATRICRRFKRGDKFREVNTRTWAAITKERQELAQLEADAWKRYEAKRADKERKAKAEHAKFEAAVRKARADFQKLYEREKGAFNNGTGGVHFDSTGF